MSQKLFALALVSAMFCASADGAPAAVERPVLKVGDSWTYKVIDNWRNTSVDTYTQTVSKIDGSNVTFVRQSEKHGTMNVTETPDLNALTGVSAAGSTMKYAPDSQLLAFPLTVGKTWESKAKFDKVGSVLSGTYDLSAKVIDWETVNGYQALKIVYGGGYQSSFGARSGSGQMHETIWYSPRARAYVKLEYHDTNWGGTLYNRFTIELVSDHVQ
ncbi:MAG TPA: hypothetical protein VMV50_01690 [Candidatus Paceibacterota bacterium]|nr:hypothetical protein [Candidatus Paceibacterota bacterium]